MYMQCRGDWKVARASTGRICVAIPLAGEMYALRVFYNALDCTYMQCRGGEALPVFYNALNCTYMQCRGDWKVARESTGRVCAAVLCMCCVYFGRASTRSYSYAVRLGFYNVLNYTYMQCPGGEA